MPIRRVVSLTLHHCCVDSSCVCGGHACFVRVVILVIKAPCLGLSLLADCKLARRGRLRLGSVQPCRKRRASYALPPGPMHGDYAFAAFLCYRFVGACRPLCGHKHGGGGCSLERTVAHGEGVWWYSHRLCAIGANKQCVLVRWRFRPLVPWVGARLRCVSGNVALLRWPSFGS